MTERIYTPNDGAAWITGASSGIGRALALRLAARGWTVAATARTLEALLTLETEAQSLKGAIRSVPADVTDEAAMAAALETIENEMGGVALAVFNAGVYIPVDAPSLRPADFRNSFAVNVMGAVHGLAPLLPRMTERGAGHIALVSSVTGYGGLPTTAAYGVAKAGLIHLAETLKLELARWGVRVTLINPGFVDTPAQDENAFPKPFMVSAESAARRIERGLRSNAFEITFPKRFTYMLKLLGLLPASWRLSLVRRRTGWDKKPSEGGASAPGPKTIR